MRRKLLLGLGIVAIGLTTYRLGLWDTLTLTQLQASRDTLTEYRTQNPMLTAVTYIGLYIMVTALSLPGAAVMTLAGGALFGWFQGTIFVSLASTTGASLAFLISRTLFREELEKRYEMAIRKINEGISKNGASYLLTLRLVPVFPFFLVNLLMGLTALPLRSFALASWLGMLPGTAAYVFAGTELSKIRRLSDVLSPPLLVAFTLLGALPWGIQRLWSLWQRRQKLARFPRPKKYDYNLIVIGAGAGGLVSAYIAATTRAKVLLIEKHKMGGDCLNTGCVPSKALIRSAHVAHLVRHSASFGISEAPYPAIDFEKVMERVRRVIREIEPHDSTQRYTQLGVECLSGEARFLSPFEIAVGDRRFTTRSVILATGAKPFVPDCPGIEAVPYFTSDSIWSLNQRPKRLLVVGGGPIGCELAQAFQRLGSSVTQVEASSRLLSREDKEVSELIERKFKEEGISVLKNHRLLRFENAGAPTAVLANGQPAHNQTETRVEFDAVLIALGRKPQLSVPGAESIGLRLLPSGGAIECDEFLETTVPHIFACGDLAGPYQFTHAAAHQAWSASVNALFGNFKRFPVDYRVLPRCTFVDPEVARVGLNETEAHEAGIPYELTIYSLGELDRAIAEDATEGFVRILTRPGTDRILGATIVGSRAGEVLAELTLAMRWNLGLGKILGTVHPYPTFSEASKYVAGEWRKARQPKSLLNWVERFHRWRRG